MLPDGSLASFRRNTQKSGTRRVHGTLVDAGADRFAVDVDGIREELAYTDVTQAHTVFEWGPQPRPGQRRRAGAATGKGVTA